MKMRRREMRPTTAEGVETWTLAYMEVAGKEGAKILNPTQYAHVVQQFELLAGEEEPTRAPYADVRPIEGFYELRDKGGVLGKINLRVYFTVVHEERLLLVLGCYKKEDEGKAPGYIKVRMKSRLRHAMSVLNGSR